MKILMAVDGSEYTRRMISFVTTHEALFPPGSDFTVHTVLAPLPERAAAFMSRQSLSTFYENEAAEVFQTVRDFVSQKGSAARFHHSVGHPAEGISVLAQQGNYDLILLGSHGHTALMNVVLGSVATGVLSRCKTPVLIVR
jgi:nucleotide-binding universal stress UspA family protein